MEQKSELDTSSDSLIDLEEKEEASYPDVFISTHEDTPSSLFKVFSTAGVIIGTISSVEFFLLGVEFAAEMDITSSVAQYAIGFIALIPNASMNISINREIAESIYNTKITCVNNRAELLKCLAKSALIFHVTAASLSATSLLLSSISNSSLPVKIILLAPTFVSNMALFYYSSKEFFTLNFHRIRELLLAPKLYELRGKLLNVTEQSKLSLYSMLSEKFHQLGPTNLEKLINIFIHNYSIVKDKNKYLSNSLIVIGITTGIGAVISYKSIGEASISIICDLFNCQFNNTILSSLLGYNALAAYLFFSMDQTSEGLLYIYQQLQCMKGDISSITKLLVSALLTMVSSIPNGYLAMKIFSESSLIARYFLIGTSFFAPAVTNIKWLHSSINNLSITPKINMFSFYGSRLICKLNTEVEPQDYRKFVETRHNIADQITTIQNKLPTIDSTEIRALDSYLTSTNTEPTESEGLLEAEYEEAYNSRCFCNVI